MSRVGGGPEGAHGPVLLQRYAAALLPVFGVPQRVLSHGSGCYVVDVDGFRYLDLLAGIAVNTLGHGHPALVEAVAKQAASLIHVSNFFTTEPQVELAETLLRIAGAPEGSAVFFGNSGTEAVEAAVKLSRRTGRTRIIAAENGFHGRSTGALALTWKPAYRQPFEPLIPDVTFVPYNDVAALERAVDQAGTDLAAIVLEPVQGEGGVNPADPAYLRAARALATGARALLVLDEIQSGMGRTGDWFAFQDSGVVPDAVTMAKGLAGGVPIGALLTFGPEVSGLLSAGQHGSTFGGNPLAAAAGLATIAVIDEDGLRAHAVRLGTHLVEQVTGLGHPRVAGVRGRGLLRAIELTEPIAAPVVSRALEAGFIVNAVTQDAVRLAPPLILDAHELDTFIAALPGILDGAA
ncbi:MAG: acetylornithine transaminase [Dermatophilaceae bacterium]